MTMTIIPRSFYNQSTEKVSQLLLGKLIVRELGSDCLVGRIVETEAYLGPHDLASHSRFGKTKRNEVIFGPPGFAYVYLIYGIYCCLNIVTEERGSGSAVLIRAIEPIEKISLKTSGPGLVCRALGIDRRFSGLDVTKKGTLYLVENPEDQIRLEIAQSPRVGVSYSGQWATKLLRFYLKDNEFVSGRRRKMN